MKRFSAKRAAQERRLRKIREEMVQGGDARCFFYPYKSANDLDHIVPRSANQKLIDKESNLIPICREAHHIITHGTTKQIKELPNLQKYLNKMKELDPSYWGRFVTNHEMWGEYD